MRRKDAILLSFFGGATVVMIAFSIIFIIAPGRMEDDDLEYLEASQSVLRLSLFIIYCIFGAGLCVQVFTAYGVNYLYIFEVDPHEKLTHHTLYRVSLILAFAWSMFFSLSLLDIRLSFKLNNIPMWLMFGLLLFLIIYCS